MCVKSSKLFEYYRKGYGVDSKISDTNYAYVFDDTYVFDALQGTKCGKNAVCFIVKYLFPENISDKQYLKIKL